MLINEPAVNICEERRDRDPLLIIIDVAEQFDIELYMMTHIKKEADARGSRCQKTLRQLDGQFPLCRISNTSSTKQTLCVSKNGRLI